jgi:hypothetical protein
VSWRGSDPRLATWGFGAVWLLLTALQRRIIIPAARPPGCPSPPLAAFATSPGLAPAIGLLMAAGLGNAWTAGIDGLLIDTAPPDLRNRALAPAGAGIMVTQGAGFALWGHSRTLPTPRCHPPGRSCWRNRGDRPAATAARSGCRGTPARLGRYRSRGCSTSTCQPAGSDVSTRKTNLGYIRWTIKPAFGSTQVRKVRGPLTEYAGPWVLSAHHIVRALRIWLAKA